MGRHMRYEIKSAILNEFKSGTRLRFSDLKTSLMYERKITNSQTTLSKYLKVLVKEGLLEREGTRAYKITSKGIALLNEQEFIQQINEKARRPYVYDETHHLHQISYMIGEESSDENFKNFFMKLFKKRELTSFQIPTDFVPYWREFIPFEGLIYINKEFGKFFDGIFEKLKKKQAFYKLEYFFMDVADALCETLSKNTFKSTDDLDLYTQLKENIERAELMRRAGPIIVSWPRTPEWVQKMMQKENYENYLRMVERMRQAYEERKANIEELLKGNPVFRRLMIRFCILQFLVYGARFESAIEDAFEKLGREVETLDDEVLEKIRNDALNILRAEAASSEYPEPALHSVEFHPNPNEVNEEIEWVKEQGWLDIIIRYVWTKRYISKIIEKVRQEIMAKTV